MACWGNGFPGPIWFPFGMPGDMACGGKGTQTLHVAGPQEVYLAKYSNPKDAHTLMIYTNTEGSIFIFLNVVYIVNFNNFSGDCPDINNTKGYSLPIPY